MRDKPDHMNPALLKTGIPLFISFAGWFFVSAITKRTMRNSAAPVPENTMEENQTNSGKIVIHQKSYSDSLGSTSLASEEEEDDDEDDGEDQYPLTHTQVSESLEILQFKQINYRPELEQEIISLKNQVSELKHREGELEERFFRYCRSQENESALKEIRNALQLEINHVDFLGLKVEIMENEKQRLESALSGYLRVTEEIGSDKLRVQLMQRRVKKLVRMKREGLSAFRRQAFVLRKRKAEISSKNEELKLSEIKAEELEAEVAELRTIVDQLQMEKNELMERLELAENLDSSTPQMNGEDPNQQGLDCEGLLAQIEQLQNERAAEIDELIYLRWVNECLRYELLRKQEQQQQQQQPCEEENENDNELVLELPRNSEVEDCEMDNDWDNQEQRCEDDKKAKPNIPEFSGDEQAKNCEMGYVSDDHLMGTTEHGEPSFKDVEVPKPASQTKTLLFGKLKRWVKGKERRRRRSCDEKENDQDKCSGRRSVSEMAIEEFTVRKSCSAVNPCCWVENAP